VLSCLLLQLLCVYRVSQVIAISDVLILCCKSERLHGDVFQFLAEASDTYRRHISAELVQFGQTLSHDDTLQSFCHGPSVILFHETQYAETLAKGWQSNLDNILINLTVDIVLQVRTFAW